MTVSLSALTHLLLNINAALDTGHHDAIGIREVKEHIQRGTVLRFLRDRCREDIDLSMLVDGSDRDFESWYESKLQEIDGGYAGQERRKWGVEKRGLCLLIAWTTEIIQRREDIEFNRKK